MVFFFTILVDKKREIIGTIIICYTRGVDSVTYFSRFKFEIMLRITMPRDNKKRLIIMILF